MNYLIKFLLISLVIISLFSQSDGNIRISRRKLRLLKKLAVILLLGQNKKIYTFPFPLPLPLPVITKTQPIIYRQRVPYPVEVPVPVPYAEPVPYPVEVPVDSMDHADAEPESDSDSYMEDADTPIPVRRRAPNFRTIRLGKYDGYKSDDRISSRSARVYRD
ncbi:uncharacterized protein LOC141848909 [Brevipalpus obovatus]|uniref:uncharacterized protein LOC141848909 n=1 Tax=Brevipalpus obovatus TaxID=246614 RepID=UPI003D9F838E